MKITNNNGTYLPTKSYPNSLEDVLHNMLQKYVGRPINDQIKNEINEVIQQYTHVDYELRFGGGNTINVDIRYDEEYSINKIRENRDKIIDELLDEEE